LFVFNKILFIIAVSRERKRRKEGVLPPRFVEVDETVVDIASPLAPQRNDKNADPEGTYIEIQIDISVILNIYI